MLSLNQDRHDTPYRHLSHRRLPDNLQNTANRPRMRRQRNKHIVIRSKEISQERTQPSIPSGIGFSTIYIEENIVIVEPGLEDVIRVRIYDVRFWRTGVAGVEAYRLSEGLLI